MARVLVVDDNLATRELLACAVRETGGEPVTAPDGSVALKELCRATAEGRPFQVMLLDISMPIVDGWQVLAAIRANPLWQDLQVIVITGRVYEADDIALLSTYDALYVRKGGECMSFLLSALDRLSHQSKVLAP